MYTQENDTLINMMKREKKNTWMHSTNVPKHERFTCRKYTSVINKLLSYGIIILKIHARI